MQLHELTNQQLQSLDDSIQEFIFKHPKPSEEPFAPIFSQDKTVFKKLTRDLVAFRRDLMKLFNVMYDNRYSWLNYTQLPYLFDEYSKYFYDEYFDDYDRQLAQIIEDHTKKDKDQGILAFILLYGLAVATSADDTQEQITQNAIDMAKAINQVTRKRIAQQIETSVKLKENRAQFEDRLKKVLVNSTRGRLIAEDQALRSFLSGTDAAATDAGMKYKTWEGVQTDEKEICGMVIGETVGMDDKFSNGLYGPLAHIRCRCGLKYSNEMPN